MLIGDGSSDIGGIAMAPLRVAGVSAVANASFASLGELTPNLPASVPVLSQGIEQGFVRRK